MHFVSVVGWRVVFVFVSVCHFRVICLLHIYIHLLIV